MLLKSRLQKVFTGLAVIPLATAFVNCSGGFQVTEGLKTLTNGSTGGIADGGSSGGTIGDASTDPLMGLAWHLSNTGQAVYAAAMGLAGNDLNLSTTWSSGNYGSGVKILISDDGSQSTHEDLAGNFNKNKVSKDYTLPSPYLSFSALPKTTEDNHGTSVSGVVAAVGWNGFGSRGVAPKSTYAIANFLSGAVAQTTAAYVDQANGDFDIFSMSWGASQDSLSTADADFEAQLKYGVTTLRGGLGALYVKASGNNYYTYCNGSIVIG